MLMLRSKSGKPCNCKGATACCYWSGSHSVQGSPGLYHLHLTSKKPLLLGSHITLACQLIPHGLCNESLQGRSCGRWLWTPVFPLCLHPWSCWQSSTPFWLSTSYLSFTFSMLNRRGATALDQHCGISLVPRNLCFPMRAPVRRTSGTTWTLGGSFLSSTICTCLLPFLAWRRSTCLEKEAFGNQCLWVSTLDYLKLGASPNYGGFKMADKPRLKLKKKFNSFSYDRRRDSVKVKRQAKSLSFKSATLETRKSQVEKRQVGTS